MQGRGVVKNQLATSPDVLSVIRDIGDLYPYVVSLHKCQYHVFMRSLSKIIVSHFRRKLIVY